MYITAKEKLRLIQNKLLDFDSISPSLDQFDDLSKEEAEAKGYFKRDFGMNQWDWPQGVAIYGLHQIGKKNDQFIINWALKQIEEGLPTKNINTVCPLLTLIDFPQFDYLTLEWMKWIENEFPRTEESGLQHITSGENKYTVKDNRQQIWADSLFMTILFIAKMGVKYNNKQWIDLAIYQTLLHTKYLLDRETALFYHGWNFETKSNYNANYWCRGNSWITLSIPLLLDILNDNISISIRNYLLNLYNNQVKQLLCLKGNDNLWHTILTDQASYTETSGSAAILAGILIGKRTHLLDSFITVEAINESIEAIIDRIDIDGVVQGVSAGTPISSDKEDYCNIVRTPMVYGQALVLLALQNYLLFVNDSE